MDANQPIKRFASPLRACLLAVCLTLGLALPAVASPVPDYTVDLPAVKPSDRMTLNFQNIDVRAALAVLSDFTGLNIVASDAVTGTVTLHVKDVPWQQVLQTILEARGLAMRRNGAIIWVATNQEIAARDKVLMEADQQQADLAPVQSRVFRLKYEKAVDLQKVLSDASQHMLSKRGSAIVIQRTNTLVVQDTPERLDKIAKLIEAADLPVQQVLIDARIVEANDNFAKNLGARLMLTGPSSQGSNTAATFSGSLAGTPERNSLDGTPSGLTYPQNLAVNLAANTINGFNPGSLALQVFKASAGTIGLELSALEADGQGHVLSNPRLITADQVEAVIQQGTEIPYQEATSSGATSISFKNAVLSLKVRPQITPDNKIIMEVQVNKDSKGTAVNNGPPSIDTKSIKTTVTVNNGDTLVIGGIYLQDESNVVNKVPVLGDIPLIGAAFRNTAKQKDHNELLIFITPQIINEALASAQAARADAATRGAKSAEEMEKATRPAKP